MSQRHDIVGKKEKVGVQIKKCIGDYTLHNTVKTICFFSNDDPRCIQYPTNVSLTEEVFRGEFPEFVAKK